MATNTQSTVKRAIRVLKLIGKVDDQISRPLVVKYSQKTNAPLRTLKYNFDNSSRTEQKLKLGQSECIFEEGNDLNIEIYQKHSLLLDIITFGHASKDELLCKASIGFDNLWKHLVLESPKEAKSNLKVEFNDPVQGLQLWLVAEAFDSTLTALDIQFKRTMENLKRFKPILGYLDSASDGVEMVIGIGKTISELNSIAKAVFSCIDIAYQHLKTQEESHKAMKSLAESIEILACQLNRLKKVPSSDELWQTINEFPGMMGEVMDFIQEWLKNWTLKYILVAAQKERVIELQDKLNNFKDKFMVELTIDMRLEQATMANDVKYIHVGVVNLQETAKVGAEKKELDDLVRTLGGSRLLLHKACMKDTRKTILQEIESKVTSANGHNVIWIRGSPGVGKSALAASISTRLEDHGRHVISFRFDRTQSTKITTEALWRVVASDLVCQYPSLCQHLVEGNRKLRSSDIDRLFKLLIETPLSTLDDDIPPEQLPVIVIDALDECGGLRHDSSGMEDFEGLLRTLKCWALVDHLKRFKVVITSRPEDNIIRMFPDTISTHVNIPSGSDVRPGDSASDDICTFLKSRLDTMGVELAWITGALEYLVPRAVGIFIWATTVADFLSVNPKIRFDSLKRGDEIEGLDDLHSLYLTVIATSFRRATKPEIKAITSVIGATIFAKQPLDDTTLMRLPGVESPHMLNYIRNGLMSVIDSNPILRFHHRSFEDFLLSTSFRQHLPNLSDVQDRNLHEHQLAALCLNCMVSSELHFNMCNLNSSSIDIPSANKSAIAPLTSYSSQFWIDHLVQTRHEKIFMKAVEFVMYEKLLFWIEVMSILGKAHEVSAILKRALEWHGLVTLDSGNKLALFIRDALRFISAFIIPIARSPPQIYLSALPFTPECSLVGEKFRPRFPNTLNISDGRPSQWPMNIFIAEHHKDPVRCIFLSPDEKTFASISVTSPEYATMYVCDSETGHCISGPFELRNLNFSLLGHGLDGCFSPDGKHILVRCRRYSALSCRAIVWDIERGEDVFSIEGFDFVFIRWGRYKGRIASMDWIDEDGSSIRTIASTNSEDEDGYPIRIVASIDSEDEDGSSIRTIASTSSEDEDGYSIQIVASTDSEDEDGSSIRTIALTDLEGQGGPLIQTIASKDSEDRGPRSTRVLVKLWDIGNNTFDRLFEVTGVTITQFSPNGRYLAVGRRSGNAIELWNLEDNRSTHQFPHPPGDLRSLHFSPTSDCLMATFWGSHHKHLWRLDTQQMVSFNLVVGYDPPAIIHLPCTNHIFVPRNNTVEIWEVSTTGSYMIFETEPLTTSNLTKICASCDGHRLLVGSFDRTVRMRNLEDLGSNHLVTQDITDVPEIIGFSSSGKIVATKSRRSVYVELRDTTTWELVGPRDVNYGPQIAFTADDNRMAVLYRDFVTIYDMAHLENRFSFDTGHIYIHNQKVAFPTCNHLVICTQLHRGGHRNDSGLLQVWKLKGEIDFTLSLKITRPWLMLLAPDGLTLIIGTSCYSWNHDTAQFDRVNFTDEAHLDGYSQAYSPDGELFACCSRKDWDVRVWNTRTGQLCGKPITIAGVHKIALSSALNDRSLGDRLIALRCRGTNAITLLDVHTGCSYAQCWDLGGDMAFIRDGTKLVTWASSFVAGATRIHDFAANHRNATHVYKPVPQDMRDGWMVGQDDEILFWVPLEHRCILSLPHVETIGGRSIKVDLSRFRYGSKWTECIDQGWLNEVEERGKEVRGLW